MIDHDLIQLENGLTVFVIKRPGFESVDLTLYVKVGSAYEDKENNGISHLLEHLLFYNRKKPELYPFGMEVGAYTKKDLTYYEAVISKKYIQEVLGSFQKIVFEPSFDSKVLEITKGITKEEIGETKDNPYEILNNRIDAHLYPETSIALPILGTKDNIDNFDLNDLKKWYQEFYTPENMIFTVVGDVAIEEIKAWVEKHFNLDRVKTDPKTDIKIKRQKENKELNIENEKFDRNYLALVYPLDKPFNLDFIIYAFLSHMINQRLRPIIESSDLFYDMDFSYFYDLFRSEYQATVSSDPENFNKIKSLMIDEIEDLDLSEDFFKKTKDYFINNLILKKDSLDQLSAITIYLLSSGNGIVNPEDEIKQVENITLSQIKEMKETLFNQDNRYFYSLK